MTNVDFAIVSGNQKPSKFAKSFNGLIHLVCPLDGDRTACGDACEGEGQGEHVDDTAWLFVESGPVSCPRCVAIIKNCRGVKTISKFLENSH